MGTDTTYVNFAVGSKRLDYIEDIAEEEDMKRTDIMRKAVKTFVDIDKTAREYGTTRQNILSNTVFENINNPSVVHSKVPSDGRAREMDFASTLSYSEMWIMKDGEAEEVESVDDVDIGEDVLCIEPSAEYFDYYVFELTKKSGKEIFKCKVSQRMTYSVLDSITEKVGDYRI